MIKVKTIPSKSDAHRALICQTLSRMTSGKTCQVVCQGTSEDIEATRRCLDALIGGDRKMYCKESGSTLRFMLPIVAALGRGAEFYPEGRLPQRPLSPLYEELASHGCTLTPQGVVPLIIEGQLTPGDFTLPGHVSSQFISGMLFALPLLPEDSSIVISGDLESKGYVDMTIETLKAFGVDIERKDSGYRIPGGQIYRCPETYQVEGDWSNGCFWLAAGALRREGIQVTGLSLDSLQGDKEILNLLKQFGAEVTLSTEGITVQGGHLQGISVDAAQIPDMVPVLAAIACGVKGETVISNAGRLRIKESDRLQSVTEVLTDLGARIRELPSGLIIEGTGSLRGGKTHSFGDHRIAMMAAVASLICEEKVILTESDAVKKSYPDFFFVMEELGLGNNIERK